MIWLKRLLPFVVLGAAALGYYFWDKTTTNANRDERDRLALLTARIWVATAEYREDPDRYLAYRDSLIAASGFSRDDVFGYLDKYQDDPERLLPFSRDIRKMVDSIYRAADSLLREEKIRAHDSAQTAGK